MQFAQFTEYFPLMLHAVDLVVRTVDDVGVTFRTGNDNGSSAVLSESLCDANRAFDTRNDEARDLIKADDVERVCHRARRCFSSESVSP